MEIETDNKKSVKGRIVTAAWQLFYEKKDIMEQR